MTIEAKKLQTVEWVLSLENEQLVDQVLETIQKIAEEGKGHFFSSYSTIRSHKFDLEEVKRSQGYKRPSAETLEQIAREANIQESTTQLLEDLKALD